MLEFPGIDQKIKQIMRGEMFDHILSLTIEPLFVGCCQLECNIQEIFPFEMTIVQTTCTGCGVTNTIGELAVYMRGMWTIIRCLSCDNVLIKAATGLICAECVLQISAEG
jgi:hypothetical protein